MLFKKVTICLTVITCLSLSACAKARHSDTLWKAPISAEEAAEYDKQLPQTNEIAFDDWEDNPIMGNAASFLYLVELQDDGYHAYLPQETVAHLRPGNYQLMAICHNSSAIKEDETDIARLVTLSLEYPMRLQEGERNLIAATLNGYANGSALDGIQTIQEIVADEDIVISMAAEFDDKTQETLPHLVIGDLMGNDLTGASTYSISFHDDRAFAEISLGDVPAGLAETRIVIFELDVFEAPKGAGVG